MIEVHEGYSEDGRLVCTLAGELDADTAPALVERLADSHRCPGLILDIERLSFIDSSGIRAFLQLREMVMVGGGTFDVVGPAPNVHRVLEITGLLELLGLS